MRLAIIRGIRVDNDQKIYLKKTVLEKRSKDLVYLLGTEKKGRKPGDKRNDEEAVDSNLHRLDFTASIMNLVNNKNQKKYRASDIELT